MTKVSIAERTDICSCIRKLQV